jgi:hypothetical protein
MGKKPCPLGEDFSLNFDFAPDIGPLESLNPQAPRFAMLKDNKNKIKEYQAESFFSNSLTMNSQKVELIKL